MCCIRSASNSGFCFNVGVYIDIGGWANIRIFKRGFRVRIVMTPGGVNGALAQLVERYFCTVEADGSTPLRSIFL